MTYSDIDLTAMANEVAEHLHKSTPERLVKFVIAANMKGHGDARLIRIMLENLLGNAFKFTGKRLQARIEFGRNDIGGDAVYYVRDNGSGFDMKFSAKLFGAFERLHSQAEYPGTGIGLATVHRIIQRHGSRVWAEAEPGKGATFYFTLRTA
jgi:light-regulated signal transduction histidine kinase (bacteriophytochrome)